MKIYLAVSWEGIHVDVFNECKRYAGLSNVAPVVKIDNMSLYKQPKGYVFKTWAASNIERMSTFGVKAKIVKH